ncbi:MAG: hypothetical protein V1708_05970 [Candidatus Micrarchaeota archaeon]
MKKRSNSIRRKAGMRKAASRNSGKRKAPKAAHHLRSRALFVPEMFRPTLEKLTVSLIFMAVLFLMVITDVPDWLFSPLTLLLAWPLLWLSGNCAGETAYACTQASSFIGLLLTLFYWYFSASLLAAIIRVFSRHETAH